jgi:hypothetical protein
MKQSKLLEYTSYIRKHQLLVCIYEYIIYIHPLRIIKVKKLLPNLGLVILAAHEILESIL